MDLIVDRKFAAVASLMTGLREVLAFDFQALIDHPDPQGALWYYPLLHRVIMWW